MYVQKKFKWIISIHSNVIQKRPILNSANVPRETSRSAVKEAFDFHLINKKVRQLYDRRFFSNHWPTQRYPVRNKNTEIRQQHRKKRPKGRSAECAFMSPERPKRESPKGLTLSLIYSRRPTPFRQWLRRSWGRNVPFIAVLQLVFNLILRWGWTCVDHRLGVICPFRSCEYHTYGIINWKYRFYQC